MNIFFHVFDIDINTQCVMQGDDDLKKQTFVNTAAKYESCFYCTVWIKKLLLFQLSVWVKSLLFQYDLKKNSVADWHLIVKKLL